VIFNNRADYGMGALILLYGDIRPRFFVEHVDKIERMQHHSGIITDSDDNTVKTINNMLCADYLSSVGLPPQTLKELQVMPFPFMVTYPGSAKGIIRALHYITPEGYGVFTAEMPRNASLTLCRLQHEGVLATADAALQKVAAVPEASAVFLFSCSLRHFLLGLRPLDEIKQVHEALQAKIPYHLAYSGGEICPLVDAAGQAQNHIHNYSFTACVL
jgi:hypothetical protein